MNESKWLVQCINYYHCIAEIDHLAHGRWALSRTSVSLEITSRVTMIAHLSPINELGHQLQWNRNKKKNYKNSKYKTRPCYSHRSGNPLPQLQADSQSVGRRLCAYFSVCKNALLFNVLAAAFLAVAPTVSFFFLRVDGGQNRLPATPPIRQCGCIRWLKWSKKG